MPRFASLFVLLFAVACDEQGNMVSAEEGVFGRQAVAALGPSTKQVGPFCNEACPDDQGLADACEDEEMTCIPSVNAGHGSECWVETYPNSTSCPSGYVVQCSCWSTASQR